VSGSSLTRSILFLVIGLLLQRPGAPASGLDAHHYLYVAIPGSETDTRSTGVSLLVFDVDNGHQFVKRLPIWPAGVAPETVRGLTLAPQAGGASRQAMTGPRLYISTTRRLAAVDVVSGKVIWEREYGGQCCDRMAVSPDGRVLYVPAFGRPAWYVVDAQSGVEITSVSVTGWPRSTAYSRDGSLAFLAAWESNVLLEADTSSSKIVKEVGPFTGYLCPFTTNRKSSMVFANIDGLVGFEVADLETGLLLDRVQIDDYPPEAIGEFECPSHGIAFAPDERELWVADGVGNMLRVFDSTPYPPVLQASVQLERQPRWVTFSLDGRYVYSSTGEVVDASAKKVVQELKDENGEIVESERMIEADIARPTGSESR